VTDFIVTRESQISTVISEEALPSVIVSQGTASVVNSIPAASVLASQAIVMQSIVSAQQGPPGISSGLVQIIAPVDLGGHRVITSDGGYADNTDLSEVGEAIGFTTGAAVQGDLVTIASSGELGGFSGLIPCLPIYLSVVGTITQIPPVIGFVQKLGMAISPTKIMIHFSDPIIL
jgi:hypothetical protein